MPRKELSWDGPPWDSFIYEPGRSWLNAVGVDEKRLWCRLCGNKKMDGTLTKPNAEGTQRSCIPVCSKCVAKHGIPVQEVLFA